MDNVELVQLVIFGFSTGIGTELAKEVVVQLKKRVTKEVKQERS